MHTGDNTSDNGDNKAAGLTYVELSPLGPTDAGDSAGPWQMSRSFARRFHRPLPAGRHAVIDVECYAANAAPDPHDEDTREPVLSCTYGYTLCTDPADPGGTEIVSYNSNAPDIPLDGGRPPFTDEDARTLCAQVDPATFTWDGRPDPTHP